MKTARETGDLVSNITSNSSVGGIFVGVHVRRTDYIQLRYL